MIANAPCYYYNRVPCHTVIMMSLRINEHKSQIIIVSVSYLLGRQ